MKRIVIIAAALVMVIGLGIGSAFAANSLQQGSFGFSVGMGDSIFGHKASPEANAFVNDVVNLEGRYFITKDMAITAGFGVQSDGGDADGTYFSITGGFRKYLKTDDFAPFVGGQLAITSVKASENNVDTVDLTVIDLSAMFGAEYFIGKQFSLEGSVGIGFGQAKDDIANRDDTYFGTRTVGVKANFYF